jgi:hypothetical protein
MTSWANTKPVLMAIVFGLVAGPLAANSFGWTVWAGSARAQLRASNVQSSALFCSENVRANVPNVGELDFDARSKLADNWARARGEEQPDAEVTETCAFKLAD